jgi:ribonuclease I
MAARTNELAIGKLLRDRRTVTVGDMEVALAEDFGRAAIAAMRVLCDRRGGQAHLSEIRLSLSAEGPTRFPDPDALRPSKGAGRGCPAGPLSVDR